MKRWEESETRGRRMVRGVAVMVGAALMTPVPASAQDPGGYENLQVLPADISRSALIDVMLANQAALGLPRRANEGCLFCHVGSMDTPSSQWDWASEENPMKDRARAMMAMVEEINSRWLGDLDGTYGMEVSCGTCHAGRTNPLPLDELLILRHREDGVNALVDTYRELRIRYYAADAYDFRVPVLASVADRLVGAGATVDAIRVHELNVESNEDPTARHGLIRLQMSLALESDGIEAMVERYHLAKDEHPPTAFTPMLISPLAWDLFRQGREDVGLRLFELNYEENPDTYVATEDLAWGSATVGNLQRALELAEAWVTGHPEHELGRRLLADLRTSGG